jgi:hypothetical protein
MYQYYSFETSVSDKNYEILRCTQNDSCLERLRKPPTPDKIIEHCHSECNAMKQGIF